MYRDPGPVRDVRIRRRLGVVSRLVGAVCGVVLAISGAAATLVVLIALLDDLGAVEALAILLSAPIFAGMAAYGGDLARRAVIVRSTDRSAFQGRFGLLRAQLGLAWASYLVVYEVALLLALRAWEMEPGAGIALVLAVCALSAAIVGVYSLRGLRRVRQAATGTPPTRPVLLARPTRPALLGDRA
ncbi:MAG: hypothetical protein HYV09_25015 [Deltaproteobacteria bacterium]|nr:hypothetical protein [Deltaproteobacteria bacterium]